LEISTCKNNVAIIALLVVFFLLVNKMGFETCQLVNSNLVVKY
jgi:hypothetical protein